MGRVTTEPIFGFDLVYVSICPIVGMADNSPLLPESTPFAMWLCCCFHHFSFLGSEPASWLAVANRMCWKWGCLVLSWGLMLPHTPLEPCCPYVPRPVITCWMMPDIQSCHCCQQPHNHQTCECGHPRWSYRLIKNRWLVQLHLADPNPG